jgi:predicted homoserine dehydrogenase-like protein
MNKHFSRMAHALLLVGAEAAAQQVRIGVIGTGCIGIEHLRNINLVKVSATDL